MSASFFLNHKTCPYLKITSFKCWIFFLRRMSEATASPETPSHAVRVHHMAVVYVGRGQLDRLHALPSVCCARTVWSQFGSKSWLVHGWKSAEIFNPEPFHLLSFQRRTSYMSWTISMHIRSITSETHKPFLFSSPIMEPPSSLLICCAVHWICFRQIWKPSGFEGTEKVPCFASDPPC
jgi:hypothetical protein